ncbi:MAG: type II secretion system protein [Actinomycetota bacterium]|nr:type II secretion system protein [Actinomycetota bacterium]
MSGVTRVVRAFEERRRTGRREDGFSLVEILVAMGVAAIVLSLVTASLAVTLKESNGTLAVNQENQLANSVLAQLQQQVTAANVVFNPATEGTNAGAGIPAGFSLRLLIVGRSGTTCEQWRVLTSHLELRSWPEGQPGQASVWRTVASQVTNPATQPPFALASTSSYDNRVLDVDLDIRTGGSPVPALAVRTSFAATDAQFFSPTDTQFCTPVPPAGAP